MPSGREGLGALRLCHFDPVTGQDDAEWRTRCGVACYDCLLSYSNQVHHDSINRYIIKDFLMRLAGSETLAITDGRDYDEQYQWLLARIDPNSTLERELLKTLYERRLRLPDHAQCQAADDVAIQPDFYYERSNMPGICVFVDGPSHDQPNQAAHDHQVREALEDRGFRVLTLRYDESLSEQVERYPDVFGAT